MADVYLSYTHDDYDWARKLARALRDVGLTVTLEASPLADNPSLWGSAVEREVATASAVIILWSASSTGSPWALRLAEAAQSRGKLVVPVLLGSTEMPRQLAHLQRADLSKWSSSGTWSELVSFAKSILLRLRLPPDLTLGEDTKDVESPPLSSDTTFDSRAPYPEPQIHRHRGATERTHVAVNSPRSIGAAWETVRAYLYPESDESHVSDDARRLRPSAKSAHTSTQASVTSIRVGTPITVIIHLPGAECRQRERRFIWRGRWHKSDFEVRYTGRSVAALQEGNVSWFVGMVCIGQLPFHVRHTSGRQQQAQAPSLTTGPGYQSVFVSYSTEDSCIVDWLETTYTALGMAYLRDVRALRSGEVWDKRLLKLIEEADLFQLCWSANARQSQYVADEWRFALGLQKPNFIRPCYWEIPMPEPPPDLQQLHFARLKLNWLTRAWFRLRARFGSRK